MSNTTKNVFGETLIPCCLNPLTGFYRDGNCLTGTDDHGTHIVCARMTKAFLDFSKAKGNDLITALPEYNFPGLRPGDHWCLCISRWMEALEAGLAPPVKLEATHIKALEYVSIEVLKSCEIAAQN